ncbi:MAG: type II secretion system protein [Planctomycetota bacterium]|jgi:prepilin-type N-terminal cleavage/methylation domain-containing protein/prepilin-type processing-associated H-X9-DG protein
MKKKGFTLIELLVVIAIIAMLLAILMPALNKVKRLAQRLVCGTSVKGLGTAMMVYAQDFEDEYPSQGGTGQHNWFWEGWTAMWWEPDKNWAEDGHITVAASLYLLVRNADVDPKSFVCRSGDETAFPGVAGTANVDLVELWDFGGPKINTTALDGSGTIIYADGLAKEHVSYAFQLPYDADLSQDFISAHPASATASASTAILSDKNPWCDPKLTSAEGLTQDEKRKDFMMLIDFLNVEWLDENPQDPLRDSTTAWQVQITNSQPHGREGQNVLFGDGHASFEKRPDISYQHDNIYTQYRDWSPFSEGDKRTGSNPTSGHRDPMPGTPSFPKTDEDSLLVNDDSRYDSHWQNLPD